MDRKYSIARKLYVIISVHEHNVVNLECLCPHPRLHPEPCLGPNGGRKRVTLCMVDGLT